MHDFKLKSNDQLPAAPVCCVYHENVLTETVSLQRNAPSWLLTNCLGCSDI